MKPFVLLATRAEDAVADGEYEAIARFARLVPAELVRVRLEANPMPAIDLDDYSGVIVGGSPFTSSDDVASKSAVQLRVERELSGLLDVIVDRDFPFLGACYGIGSLGTHQGAIVDREHGEPVGPTEIQLTNAGREDPLLNGLPATFTAFVGHKEAISELPEHAALLASSAGCPVQMFRVKRNVYATQFHPELTPDGIVERIWAYRHNGYFPPEDAEALVERVRSAPVTEPGRILANFVERYR